MTKEIEDYINFVQKMIQKYQKSVQLISDDRITPPSINSALANYGNVLFILTSEYQRKKSEAYELQLDFESWWDEKFTQSRQQLNNPELPASKWASKQELESYVRATYKNEYKEWKTKLFSVESKVSFYRQMLENWKRIENILVNLSLNMRSELKALSVEDRANRKLDDESKAYTSVPPRRRKVVEDEQ